MPEWLTLNFLWGTAVLVWGGILVIWLGWFFWATHQD